MAYIYPSEAFDPRLIQSRTVAIIGYGNQGHAHALNLRDSGVKVLVGSQPRRKSYQQALADGFVVLSVGEAAKEADVLVLALPDETMAGVYAADVRPFVKSGKCLVFVHGFNLRFGLIKPPRDTDVVVVGPKGPGWGLRAAYRDGNGLAAFVAVHQDYSGEAEALALSYAWGLGCARSIVMRTSVAEETETDLFGEQAVLCGGIPALIQAGYDTLIEAGYQPEVAYFEVLHETKLIVDLIVSRGIAGMRQAISDTAEFGGYLAGEAVVTDQTREAMRGLLARIQSGEFAKQWVSEARNGRARMQSYREDDRNHTSEEVGAKIRQQIGL